MRFLHKEGRTFRVERVPLCYMTEFAHCSTETRKIVKGEERVGDKLDVRPSKDDKAKPANLAEYRVRKRGAA